MAGHSVEDSGRQAVVLPAMAGFGLATAVLTAAVWPAVDLAARSRLEAERALRWATCAVSPPPPPRRRRRSLSSLCRRASVLVLPPFWRSSSQRIVATAAGRWSHRRPLGLRVVPHEDSCGAGRLVWRVGRRRLGWCCRLSLVRDCGAAAGAGLRGGWAVHPAGCRRRPAQRTNPGDMAGG